MRTGEHGRMQALADALFRIVRRGRAPGTAAAADWQDRVMLEIRRIGPLSAAAASEALSSLNRAIWRFAAAAAVLVLLLASYVYFSRDPVSESDFLTELRSDPDATLLALPQFEPLGDALEEAS